MNISNHKKHTNAVLLVGGYIKSLGYEYSLTDSSSDIYIPASKTFIKIFSNYSKSNGIKVSNNLTLKDDILYLVVKPTRMNAHGFSCVGGNRDDISSAIQVFNTPEAPKNIRTDALKSFSIEKHIKQIVG